MRKFLAALAALIPLVVIVALAGVAAPVQAEGGYSGIPQSRTEDGFPILGNPSAQVTLVEFSNFSCPGCLSYTENIKQIVDAHVRTDQAQFIFMPMIFGDDPSLVAAQGALCADKQDKFWDMHDALFEIHRNLGAKAFTPELVVETAKTLGADSEALSACLNSGETRTIVQRSITRANMAGVQYTPTLMYSMDGGNTLQFFARPEGGVYDSGVPVEVVAATLERARAGQLTPAPTVTPTPIPVDPYAYKSFVAWKSVDGLLSYEIPDTWESRLSPQNGPISYVVSPPQSETSGILILALPIAELGLAAVPEEVTGQTLLQAILGDQFASQIRAVEAGGLKGGALRQTFDSTDRVTGAAITIERDLWVLVIDSQNVLILQVINLIQDSDKMLPIKERLAATLTIPDAQTFAGAITTAFLPPTPIPSPTPVTGFTPVKTGEGKCVGVKAPEGVELPDGKSKQFDKAPELNLNSAKIYCAILSTKDGQIVIQLYPEVAPLHVNSFVFLAREGFYNGITWHRVITDFVAQTGDPSGTGSGGPGYEIPLEVNPVVRYDQEGVLGMARTNDPNSAGSQFFITYAALPNLDASSISAGYTIFGQVVEGMDVTRKITPRDPSGAVSGEGDTLISVVIVEVDK